ncbi:MAG: DNA-binding protein, partial [Deltaproteobacteria bacterium]|nr:DNA-binding protein [Deltaproteobacteria bacterium]
LVKQFVSQLHELFKKAAFEQMKRALEGIGIEKEAELKATRSPPAKPKVAAPAAVVPKAKRRKKGKRPKEELEQLGETIEAHLRQHPGQRIGEIAKVLGMSPSDLTNPIRKLLSEQRIRAEGIRRSTRYYPVQAEAISASEG